MPASGPSPFGLAGGFSTVFKLKPRQSDHNFHRDDADARFVELGNRLFSKRPPMGKAVSSLNDVELSGFQNEGNHVVDIVAAEADEASLPRFLA